MESHLLQDLFLMVRYHSLGRKSKKSGKKSKMSDRDTTYLDAVYRGDMKTAQRMVDEFTKQAGFSTEHLYHGTPVFGFTTIDIDF